MSRFNLSYSPNSLLIRAESTNTEKILLEWHAKRLLSFNVVRIPPFPDTCCMFWRKVSFCIWESYLLKYSFHHCFQENSFVTVLLLHFWWLITTMLPVAYCQKQHTLTQSRCTNCVLFPMLAIAMKPGPFNYISFLQSWFMTLLLPISTVILPYVMVARESILFQDLAHEQSRPLFMLFTPISMLLFKLIGGQEWLHSIWLHDSNEFKFYLKFDRV